MQVRFIEARVYIHATEVREKVLQALRNVIGESKIVEEELSGYFGNPIIVVSASKEKEEAQEAFNKIVSLLTEPDRKLLTSTLEERLSEEGSLYLRFDKQKAYNGKLVLSEEDDVIKVKVRFQHESRSALISEIREAVEGLRR
ncbi:MAG: RNA-binding domain-containing protein [Acidilobus sp.]